MKKLTLLLIIGLLSVLMSGSVCAVGDEMEWFNSQEKEDKPVVQQCPKTLMTESCFSCHIIGNFRVKETAPDAHLVYPNPYTKIIENKGYIFLTDIISSNVKESLNYFDIHDIKYVIMEIHSPGGSLLDAWRIIGLMRKYEKSGKIIETRCSGFAASAGFLVFCSGTKGYRFVNSQAELMWHELYTFSMFKIDTPSDSAETTRVLRHLQDTANNWLASVSKMTKEEIDEKVKKKEFWINGDEAVKLGFADGLLN